MTEFIPPGTRFHLVQPRFAGEQPHHISPGIPPRRGAGCEQGGRALARCRGAEQRREHPGREIWPAGCERAGGVNDDGGIGCRGRLSLDELGREEGEREKGNHAGNLDA